MSSCQGLRVKNRQSLFMGTENFLQRWKCSYGNREWCCPVMHVPHVNMNRFSEASFIGFFWYIRSYTGMYFQIKVRLLQMNLITQLTYRPQYVQTLNLFAAAAKSPEKFCSRLCFYAVSLICSTIVRGIFLTRKYCSMII